MLAHFKHTILVLTVFGTISSASAYSLLLKGYDTWQTDELGYQLEGDIGGPANQFRGEEYRWNVKTIYYGYDITFLNFFGSHGTNAIAQAFAVLNSLPAASQMSSNLVEYPLDSTRVNYRASALGLRDLKSTTLNALLEQMGLADPQRWVWCLYSRAVLANPDRTNYAVIKRNYDPVTRDISSYVNGVLYTYVIQETPDYADAFEVQVDPLQIGFTSVASDFVSAVGAYFTGLTRDDVGGLKRLYEKSSLLIQNHFESLPDGTEAEAGSNPWLPYPSGTNTTTTNTISIVTNALRAGVDKIEFKTGNYDAYLGAFVVSVTNKWDDYFRTNMYAPIQMQKVQRVVAQPDILFVSDYLGTTDDGFPVTFQRSDTANWINNSTNNGVGSLAGPGVINGQVVFTYSPLGPYFINQNPYLLDETRLLFEGISWGSFDGTTNDPIVYPTWASLQQLQLQAIYGGGSPWTVPDSTLSTTNSGTVGTRNAGGTQ